MGNIEKAALKVGKDGKKYCLFFGENRTNGVCSNWYKSEFILDGIKFCCVEQYMMYKKAILFNDKVTAQKILNTNVPKIMKRLGKEVKNFDGRVWENEKYGIVFTGVAAKFNQNSDLGDWLKETDCAWFVEASPYDDIWGVKLDAWDERCLNPSEWRGRNLLGQAILEVKKVYFS